MLLGLNLDHAATLREARYRDRRGSPLAEPDIVEAARVALVHGADSLTLHTRADRRHMQPEDALAIQAALPDAVLNLEMGITDGMLAFAARLRPAFACLVPEGRQEVTTEGGLDVAGSPRSVADAIARLQAHGTRVSLFIDPEEAQVRAAAAAGAEMIELHTGPFADAAQPDAAADVRNPPDTESCRRREVARLAAAAELGHALGLQVNAGHGLRVDNLAALAPVPHLAELNIGHSTIARALFLGLGPAVAELRAAIDATPWTRPGGPHPS